MHCGLSRMGSADRAAVRGRLCRSTVWRQQRPAFPSKGHCGPSSRGVEIPIAGPDKSASHLASMQRNQADEPQRSTAPLITISLSEIYGPPHWSLLEPDGWESEGRTWIHWVVHQKWPVQCANLMNSFLLVTAIHAFKVSPRPSFYQGGKMAETGGLWFNQMEET